MYFVLTSSLSLFLSICLFLSLILPFLSFPSLFSSPPFLLPFLTHTFTLSVFSHHIYLFFSSFLPFTHFLNLLFLTCYLSSFLLYFHLLFCTRNSFSLRFPTFIIQLHLSAYSFVKFSVNHSVNNSVSQPISHSPIYSVSQSLSESISQPLSCLFNRSRRSNTFIQSNPPLVNQPVTFTLSIQPISLFICQLRSVSQSDSCLVSLSVSPVIYPPTYSSLF